MIPEGKRCRGFPYQAMEKFAFFVLDARCMMVPSEKQPEVQNIQRNTGGIDPLSKNATMAPSNFTNIHCPNSNHGSGFHSCLQRQARAKG